jgi:hypothetical protein
METERLPEWACSWPSCAVNVGEVTEPSLSPQGSGVSERDTSHTSSLMVVRSGLYSRSRPSGEDQRSSLLSRLGRVVLLEARPGLLVPDCARLLAPCSLISNQICAHQSVELRFRSKLESEVVVQIWKRRRREQIRRNYTI